MKHMKWYIMLAAALLMMGCGTASEQPAASGSNGSGEDVAMKMNIAVNDSSFTATLAENAAVDALVDWMEEGPITLELSDYAGFEKVGPLGRSLPASDSKTTTQAWSYTRLGSIDDLTGWEDALGSGDVTVTLSLAE